MKVQSIMLAIAVGATAASDVLATEYHVYSDVRGGMTGTQQLTNAFKRATNGDVITIHAGTYKVPTDEMTFRYETDAAGTLHATAGTCLDSSAANLTVRGDPDAGRDEIILDGNEQHAIMRLTGSNSKVCHLTFYKGSANHNAIVYRNGAQMNTDKWIFRRGGGLTLSDGICEDCVFDTCYAGQGACIYAAKVAKSCVFKKSNAVANNAGCAVCAVNSVYDSTFAENTRGCLRGCDTIASNCVFVANLHNGGTGLLYYQTGALVDCVFSNNTTVAAYLHGDKYMPKEITRCTFFMNSDSTYSAGIGGTVACTKPVKDCTFVGALQISNVTAKVSGCAFYAAKGKVTVGQGFIADCPTVEDCTFEGGDAIGASMQGNGTKDGIAAIWHCSLERCTVNGVNIRHGPLFRNCRTLRNCLITGAVTWGSASAGGFLLTDGEDSVVENCTFTTNAISTGAYANSSNGKLTFKNCLFFNNNISGKGFRQRDWPEPVASVYMDHCFFKAPGDWSVNGVTATAVKDWTGDGSVNFYGDWETMPGFKKDARGGAQAEYPYALVRKSICAKKGVVASWMSTATDLAGNPRLYGGCVDIGCYQNCEPVPGGVVLIK